MSKIKRTSVRRHKKTTARFPTVIFTLFGVYIIPRGGRVRVSDLIELVRPLGFSPNAIRLGLSRMARRGVFRVHKRGRYSHYSLSRRGMKFMETGRVRAFDLEHKKWDGKWRLIAYRVPEALRGLRDEFREKLQSLGFANLSASVWISPRSFRSEIISFVKRHKMTEYVETFEADYNGLRRPRDFAAALWAIGDLENRYQAYIDKYAALRSEFTRSARKGDHVEGAACFADRFCLTAEYVALRLDDPMLPLELLPAGWVGVRAKRLHDDMWSILEPAAGKFIDSVLRK
jgi:phenylacetic acid degradation operon negative regulatory protein